MRFITFVAKNLLRRKMRSLLTVSGVAIAVGTAVALLGVSDGFERSTVESFEARGVDIVVVAEGVMDQLNSDLDQNFAKRIAALPGVSKVGAGLLELVQYTREGTIISLLVQGWPPGSFLFDDLELLSGRRIRAGDRRVAMLGKVLADNIDKKVGDSITIQRADFEIVGIYRSFSVYENGAVTVPLDELQKLMLREGSVTGFSVVLKRPLPDGLTVDAVAKQINELTDDEDQHLGLSAMATRDYVSNSAHIRMAQAMAWITSVIAIVVGTIGVLNTMIMSVVERLREISILRAIGWRKSRVVRMILGESCLLSFVGAVVGTVVAVVLIRWLATLPQASGFITGRIAPVVMAKGLLIAAVVALIGGTYPAYHAARLPPSEGLRHE